LSEDCGGGRVSEKVRITADLELVSKLDHAGGGIRDFLRHLDRPAARGLDVDS